MLCIKPLTALAVIGLSWLFSATAAYGGTALEAGRLRPASSDTRDVSSPILSFTASAFTIPRGDSITLFWTSTNTTSCSASGAWGGPKSTRGARVLTPVRAGTYILTCGGAGGSVTESVTVEVIRE